MLKYHKMKKLILLFAVLITIPSMAQEFQGKAYYESKSSIDMSGFGGRNGQMSEERKKQIAERMKGMFEKTYILTFNRSESLYKEEENNSLTASVFPLAFPLIAGPGSLTTLLSIRAEYRIENIIIAVVLNVIVIFIVLKTSKKIERFIGPNGINIVRKIFGVILLAIAVKLFTSNIKVLLA